MDDDELEALCAGRELGKGRLTLRKSPSSVGYSPGGYLFARTSAELN